MKCVNLGILAHVDAGKTTLTEHMLYLSGALRAPGSVEKGNTQSDRLSVEKERGISVRASPVTLVHRDVRINIIDTPGHVDFTGEAERALLALDAAVLVVSAAEGVQSQTVIFWQALRAFEIPTIIFMNKIDRMGCDPEAVRRELKEEFTEHIYAVNAAAAPGSRECGLRAAEFTDDDIIALCELDGALAAEYLEGGDGVREGGGGDGGGDGVSGGSGGGGGQDDGSVRGSDSRNSRSGGSDGGGDGVNGGGFPGAERLKKSIAGLSGAGAAFTLLHGSAALGVGAAELLDAIVDYLPAAELDSDAGVGAVGVIYKIEHDAAMGKIAYARLFSGVLRNRDAVVATDARISHFNALMKSGIAKIAETDGGGASFFREPSGAEDGADDEPAMIDASGLPPPRIALNKITQIRRISGAKAEDTGILTGGDAAAIIGLTDARAGDLIHAHYGDKPIGATTASASMYESLPTPAAPTPAAPAPKKPTHTSVVPTSETKTPDATAPIALMPIIPKPAVRMSAVPASIALISNIPLPHVPAPVATASITPSPTSRMRGDATARAVLSPLIEKRLRLSEQLRLAEPLFSVQVTADAGKAAGGQENKLLQAVRELYDEDPLLEYEWEPDERELVLRVMGRIQLEIMETLFMERYGLAVRFSPPTVIYKETPKGLGVGLEEYTMPKPCWAVVQLAVEPRPRGTGYLFESAIKGGELPYRYQRHVALSVPGALKQGMYNWQVVDIKVTLTGGEHHHVHTHPLDFFLATPIAVMQALKDAGTQLLEPVTLMRMTAPEELAGKLIGDIAKMRGTFDSPAIRNGAVTIEALLPVSESIDYPVRFASYASGKGSLRASFAGYRECPAERGASARRRGVNPLDRMRWILYKRNAL